MSLQSMRNRLVLSGGSSQQDRMIFDKRRSLMAAINNSYQGATFRKAPSFEVKFKGLFNPKNLTENFDQKVISTIFDNNMKAGTVFEWVETGTYWLCFLQNKDELAYFRGDCRRCNHIIKWIDGNRKEQHTYASIIGPSQPTIRTSASMQAAASQDFPNAGLKILIPADDLNKGFFHRYQTFLIDGTSYIVEQIDTISMPGILQINATENYTNKIEDDVENNVSNVWNVQPIVKQKAGQEYIIGPIEVGPLEIAEFSTHITGGHWVVMENELSTSLAKLPLEIIDGEVYKQKVRIKWLDTVSGSYTIGYKTINGEVYQRHVIVRSLL